MANCGESRLKDLKEATDDVSLYRKPSSAVGAVLAVTPTYGEEVALKVYKRRFLGLVALALLNLTICWNFVNFSYAGDYVAEHFSISVSTVNWFSITFLFSGLLGNYPASLALRRGTKLSMLVAASGLVIGSWLKYGGTKITSVPLTMIGQIIIGFIQPFVINAPVFYSETWFGERTRATATALSSIPPIFGGVMASLISPAWIKALKDVSPTTLYMSIICTAVAVIVPFVPAKPPTPPELDVVEHKEKTAWQAELKMLFRRVEFYLVAVPFICGGALFNTISTILYPVLVPFGYSYAQVGLAGTVIIVVGQGLSLIISPLCDRFRCHLYFIKGGAVLLVVAMILMIWSPPSHNVAFVFGQCSLFSIAILGPSPVNLEFITQVLYPLRVEFAISIMWAGSSLLGGVLIIASSYMFDSQGTNMPAVYMCVGIGCAALPFPLSLGLFGRKDHVVMNRAVVEEALRDAQHAAVH